MTNMDIMAKLAVARDAAKVQYDTLNEVLEALVRDAQGDCPHEHIEDITGAGEAARRICIDCGRNPDA